MHTYIFCLLSILAMINGVWCEEWYETGNPHFLQPNNVFEAVKDSNSIKILKFFSPWCKYCRYIKTYVDKYKGSHDLSPNLKFYEFNCQGNAGMFCAQHFQVRAYPAVLMINQKGETVSRIDGLYPQDVIYNILDDFNRKAIQLNKTLTHQQTPSPQQSKEEQKQQNKQQPKTELQSHQQAKPENKEQKRQQTNINNQPNKSQQKQLNKQQIQVQSAKSIQTQAKPDTQQAISSAENNQKQGETVIPIVVKKQMVEEKNLQDFSKPNPNDPDKQKQFKKEEIAKNESVTIVKYFLYLVGIVIGGAYAYHIWINKQQQQRPPLRSQSRPPTGYQNSHHNSGSGRVIGSRDIQNQMLVEEVMDENL